MDKLQFAAREHERLVEIAVERTRAEIPVYGMTDQQLTSMVEYCLGEAIEERGNCIQGLFPSLYMDTFSRVIWPATKIRLSSELSVTVSVDDSYFEEWLRRD